MNLFTIAGLSLGITCSILALFLLLQGKTKLHRIWALFNFVVAIWGFGCFIVGIASTESDALFGWRFAHVGGLFISIFFYQMICELCDLKRKKSIITAYSIGLFFLLLDLTGDQFINRTQIVFDIYFNDATWLYTVAVGLWLSVVACGFIELIRFLPKTKGLKRTQILYIIFGFLIGFLGGISNFSVSVLLEGLCIIDMPVL